MARELEERVEYWHTHETGGTLGEFLGINREEYRLWLEQGDDALLALLNAKRTAVPVSARRAPRAEPLNLYPGICAKWRKLAGFHLAFPPESGYNSPLDVNPAREAPGFGRPPSCGAVSA